MVSVQSAVLDSSTGLTKREILPIVQCLISRTHMTDAQSHFSACSLQWALKFADCTLHPQLYFTVGGGGEMKSGIEDKTQQVRFTVRLQRLVIILPAPIVAF